MSPADTHASTPLMPTARPGGDTDEAVSVRMSVLPWPWGAWLLPLATALAVGLWSPAFLLRFAPGLRPERSLWLMLVVATLLALFLPSARPRFAGRTRPWRMLGRDLLLRLALLGPGVALAYSLSDWSAAETLSALAFLAILMTSLALTSAHTWARAGLPVVAAAMLGTPLIAYGFAEFLQGVPNALRLVNPVWMLWEWPSRWAASGFWVFQVAWWGAIAAVPILLHWRVPPFGSASGRLSKRLATVAVLALPFLVPALLPTRLQPAPTTLPPAPASTAKEGPIPSTDAGFAEVAWEWLVPDRGRAGAAGFSLPLRLTLTWRGETPLTDASVTLSPDASPGWRLTVPLPEMYPDAPVSVELPALYPVGTHEMQIALATDAGDAVPLSGRGRFANHANAVGTPSETNAGPSEVLTAAIPDRDVRRLLPTAGHQASRTVVAFVGMPAVQDMAGPEAVWLSLTEWEATAAAWCLPLFDAMVWRPEDPTPVSAVTEALADWVRQGGVWVGFADRPEWSRALAETLRTAAPRGTNGSAWEEQRVGLGWFATLGQQGSREDYLRLLATQLPARLPHPDPLWRRSPSGGAPSPLRVERVFTQALTPEVLARLPIPSVYWVALAAWPVVLLLLFGRTRLVHGWAWLLSTCIVGALMVAVWFPRTHWLAHEFPVTTLGPDGQGRETRLIRVQARETNEIAVTVPAGQVPRPLENRDGECAQLPFDWDLSADLLRTPSHLSFGPMDGGDYRLLRLDRTTSAPIGEGYRWTGSDTVPVLESRLGIAMEAGFFVDAFHVAYMGALLERDRLPVPSDRDPYREWVLRLSADELPELDPVTQRLLAEGLRRVVSPGTRLYLGVTADWPGEAWLSGDGFARVQSALVVLPMP